MRLKSASQNTSTLFRIFFLAAETRGWVWHTREVDLPQGAVALQGIGQVAGPLTADAVGCMEADGSYAARCVTAEQWLH